MERFLADHMAADLADIGRMRMPFGKYGPEHFPPSGVPIYDLQQPPQLAHRLFQSPCDGIFDDGAGAAGFF